MKKKVLHLFRNLKYGGNQALAYNLVKYSDRKYSHSILSLHDDLEMESEFKELGCSIHVIRHKELSFRSFEKEVRALLMNENYETVVTWFYPYVLRLNFDSVNTLHHVGTAPLKSPLINWLKSLLIIKFLSHNTGSVAFASKYIEECNYKAFKHKFHLGNVIYNGIDTKRFSPKSEYTLGDNYTITMVGRLDGSKDFDGLIKSVKHLDFIDRTLVVNIVGDGHDRNRLELLAEKYDVTDKVTFLGRRADIPDILRDSDLSVFLNKPLEGFGLVLLEAMSCGVPVISNNLGANPEIIENGVDGFLVSTEQDLVGRIRELYSNCALSKRIGEAGRRKVVEKFDVKVMVREYEKLY